MLDAPELFSGQDVYTWKFITAFSILFVNTSRLLKVRIYNYIF